MEDTPGMLLPSCIVCPCSSILCTRREYPKMSCDLISLALSLCLALLLSCLTLFFHDNTSSIYEIIPILKNPRQVLLPSWNLCWLLPSPLTSLLTEQVPHFLKGLSHNLAINYILSCLLQRRLVSHVDNNLGYGNPMLVQLRVRKVFHEKTRKLSSSPLFCCSSFSWKRNGSNDCERLHEVGGRIAVSLQGFTDTSFISEMEVRRSLNNAMGLGILSLVQLELLDYFHQPWEK